MISRPRSVISAFALALAASFVVMGTVSPAQADQGGDRPGVSLNGNDNGADIEVTQTETTVTPGTTGSTNTGSGSGSTGTGIPGLPGVTGPATGPGTGSCDPSLYPGGYSEGFAVPSPCIQPTCTSIHPVTGNVVGGGANCEDEVTPPAPPVITTAMVMAAARVVAPQNPPHVEPGTLSFVNIPNNYWAAPPAVNDSLTLLGVTIPLQWRPTSTTWSFGDGSTATGNGVQGADLGAPGTVEHAYRRQGSYDISTTTNYNLTFVIPGSGAQTIAVTSPPSAPVTLPIREIQTLTSYVN